MKLSATISLALLSSALASPVTIQRRQGGGPSTATSRGQGFLSNLLGLITNFENSADDNSSVDFKGIFASAVSYAEAQASSAAARIGAARAAVSSTSSAVSGGITQALKVASASASSSSSSSSASKSASASANPKALGAGAVAPPSSSSKSSSPSSSTSSASPSKASSSASSSSGFGTTRPSSAPLSLTPSSSSPKPSASVSSSTSSKPPSSAVPTPSSSSSSSASRSSSSSSPSAPSASASATSGTQDTADQPTFLSLHNAFRAHYGASAVTWNDTLAVYAYNAAKTCKYGHTGGPYGENIAAGVGGGYDVTKGFNSWANEASLYNYSSPGYSGTTGHFTQIVWKATSQIGCAAVTCPDGSIFTGYGQNSLYLVCEYYVPGNWVDPSNSANTAKYFTQNVGPYQA